MNKYIKWNDKNIDVFSELMSSSSTSAEDDDTNIKIFNNHLYFYSDIDRSSILKFIKRLNILVSRHILHAHENNLNKPLPIYLHINSNGGNVYDSFAGMDAILKAKKTVDIITIIEGVASSGATLLSFVGTKRMMSEHSSILIHELRTGTWGPFTEIEDNYKNSKVVMNTLKSIYKKYTKLTEEKLEELLKHDLYFMAEDCLKFGFVDKIDK